MSLTRKFLLGGAAALFSFSAAQAATSLSEKDVNELLTTLKAQGKQLAVQQKQIEALQSKLSKMEKAPAPAPAQARPNAPGQQQAQAPRSSSAPAEVGVDRKPAPPERPPEIARVIDEGGVLLPKGRVVFTPSAEYTRSSATRVAIEGFSIIPALNIGLFNISQVNRDTATGAIAGRVGVTNRFEIDGKVPYVYRHDETLNRPIGTGSGADVLTNVTGSGIGDVEVGAHYQINRGTGGWPYFVANLRFKSITGTGPLEVPTDPSTGLQTELPTGSGFYAWQPSVTMIFPSDPAVFYANAGYIYNVSRTFSKVGTVDPGDSIGLSFGMSLSLNDRSSFSVGYSHNTVFETTVNDQKLTNGALLQVGTLDMGYAYSVSDLIALNLNVSAGVTEDAPDARITLRVPISMNLF